MRKLCCLLLFAPGFAPAQQRSGATSHEVMTEFKSQDTWVPGFKVHMEQMEGSKPRGQER